MQDKVRKNFQNERQRKIAKDELVAAQAQPIVTPIVKAIEKTKPASEDVSMTSGEIKEHVNKILRLGIEDLNRKRFLVTVRELYQNERLFNVLLAMVRLGHINRFPIKKITTIGPIDSLIFYGQGGKNLDFVIGVRQDPEFKLRLNGFNAFYKKYEAIIDGIIHEVEPDVEPEVDSEDEFNRSMRRRAHEMMGEIEESIRRRSQKRVRISSSDDDDDDYYGDDGEIADEWEDDGNDTLVAGDKDVTHSSGSGLVKKRLGTIHAEKEAGNASLDIIDIIKKRLGTIHAEKGAGNTSLDIVNEAHDLLKTLLKIKSISKAQYQQLHNLYD